MHLTLFCEWYIVFVFQGEKGVRRKRIARGKLSNRLSNGEDNSMNEGEELDEDGNIINSKGHRRAGERNGQVKSGALSGGPRRVS